MICRGAGYAASIDADEQIDLWGKYLAEELPAIYGEQAAAVVVFVSADYAARDWTRHERRAALGRAVRERREYVLPARFDDTVLPGLLPDMVTIDLRGRSAQQFAGLIAGEAGQAGYHRPRIRAGARHCARACCWGGEAAGRGDRSVRAGGAPAGAAQGRAGGAAGLRAARA